MLQTQIFKKKEEPVLSMWVQVLRKNDLLGIYFILKKHLSLLGVTRSTSKWECFMNVTCSLDFRLTLRKGERQELSGAVAMFLPTLAPAGRDLLPSSCSVPNGAGPAPPPRSTVDIVTVGRRCAITLLNAPIRQMGKLSGTVAT